MNRFRHSLNSIREVVLPALLNSGPYMLALAAVGGIAWFVWFGKETDVPDADGIVGEAGVDRFIEAEALVANGEVDQARALMRELAPYGATEGERGGDPRAHWWLAKDLLSGGGRGEPEKPAPAEDEENLGLEEADAPKRPQEILEEVIGRLEEVVSRDTSNEEAVIVLTKTYVLAQKLQKAFALVDERGEDIPTLHLLGAELAARLGDRRKRDAYGAAASAYFKRACSDEALSEAEREIARPRWALSEIVLENYAEARDVLRASSDGDPEHVVEGETAEVRWRPLLVRAWLGEMRQGLRQGEFSQVMDMLVSATEEVGLHPRLVEIGGGMASMEAEGLSGRLNDYFDEVNEAAAETEVVGMHVALGSFALALDRSADGLVHLEKVVALDPENVVALNNLGYGLAFLADPPHYDRAMELLDRATEVGRQRRSIPANVWETRGQILTKLERWAEAAIDLERALHSMPEQEAIHRSLALAYGELGQEELSDRHRNVADELAKKDAGE